MRKFGFALAFVAALAFAAPSFAQDAAKPADKQEHKEHKKEKKEKKHKKEKKGDKPAEK